MNILIIKDNKVFGALNHPTSEVEKFKLANPIYTVVVDEQRLGIKALGMDYDPVTGQLSGEPYVPPPPPKPPVSVATFKTLFTSTERIAIKNARPTDTVIDDFYDILDDPRTTTVNLELASTVEYLDHLVSINIITESRKQEILLGIPQ